MKALLVALPAAALFVSAPAPAQFAQVNDPAPGYSSLMSADYATAEREIRAANVSKYLPTRRARSTSASRSLSKAIRATPPSSSTVSSWNWTWKWWSLTDKP